MKKVTSKNEREKFLSEKISKEGAFFVVRHKKENELFWFTKHNFRGSDWFLEAPVCIRRIKIESKKDRGLFRQHGYTPKNGYAYEVFTPQVSPFLPEELEIEFLSCEEEKALEWMLDNTYANHDWRN